jgi:trehalose 6-phosphate phosphatase
MNGQIRHFGEELSEGELPAVDRSRTALFLDIDGTLLDIAPRPDAVAVPGELPCDLIRLNRCLGGALALVSGRPLAEIDQLFAPLRLSAIGCHGAEIRTAAEEGVACAEPLPEALRHSLAGLSGLDRGIIVEDKLYSLALHYRAAPQLGDTIHAAAEAAVREAASGSVELLTGKCVVEVKRCGFNKGSGLRALMAVAPFQGRKPIYIGDDRTDQDALHVLPEFGGVGIAVGRALAGADYTFKDPRDVRRWLAGIASSGGCE